MADPVLNAFITIEAVSPASHHPACCDRRVGSGVYRQAISRAGFLVAVLGLAACAAVAPAHEMNIFVHRVEGTFIHGRVYFKGGAAAQGVAVRVTDSQGNRLGETTTDADGQFVFVAKTRCDHLFAAELEDGHATRRPSVVRREQLPDSLPESAQTGATTPQTATPRSSLEPTSFASPTSSTEHASSAGGTTSQKESPHSTAEATASIAAQLDDIRERLERMETAVRWRDLLGGIGYILGTAGIAFYLMARRASQGSAR